MFINSIYTTFWIIWLILYTYSLPCLSAIKEGILKITRNIYRLTGYDKDNPEEICVTFNKWICVF